MITKISGESPFQVLTSNFSISPSESGYQLEISADGVNYSPLFTVGAGVTRLVTGVAANSYYRLAGNTSDVVVNWQKSCGGDDHGGGGGGTGATITVDSALSSSSTNPVENRVITNALAEIEGGTVDSALTSGSTNAVESRAIYEAFAGSDEPITIFDTVSSWFMQTQDSNWSQFEDVYFKNTSSERYKVINLSTESVYDGIPNFILIQIYGPQGVYGIDVQNFNQPVVLNQTYQLVDNPWLYPVFTIPTSGGDTYLVLDVEQQTIVVTHTLPTAHVDGMFQIPVAQDDSNFKRYVYNGTENNKKVVSRISATKSFHNGGTSKYDNINVSYTNWNNATTQVGGNIVMSPGDSYSPGVKTHRDSNIINTANEALAGFEEVVTLTLTNEVSDDYIHTYYGGVNQYFYKTDDTRYVVLPTSGLSYPEIDYVTLNDVEYFFLSGNSFKKNVRKQLGEYRDDDHIFVFCNPNNFLYLVVDKETKTIFGTDSLTITRGKNLADAFDNIPTPDMSDYWTTAQTQNAIEEALYGAIITGATMPVDSELDSASTHPVENRAIYEYLNGETAATQMVVSSEESRPGYMRVYYRLYYNNGNNTSSNYVTFYKTNIPGYHVANLSSITQRSNTTRFTIQYMRDMNSANWYYPSPFEPTLSTIGDEITLTNTSGNVAELYRTNLEDTDTFYAYYFIYNENDHTCFLAKTLPTIDVVTGGRPNWDDLPTAQDGSDFNQFVYNGNTNATKVLTSLSQAFVKNETQAWKTLKIDTSGNTWNAQSYERFSTTIVPAGNNKELGIKTFKDSEVINKANEVLTNFDEQLTLTITGVSETDNLYLGGGVYAYLKETNNSRYEVLDFSELSPSAYTTIQYFTIGESTYYIYNLADQRLSIADNVGAKFELQLYQGMISAWFYDYANINGQNYYFIIDKEMMTATLASSLTISVGKNLEEYVENKFDECQSYTDNQISNLEESIDLTDVVRSTSISTIVRCTQAQYDAIAIKDEGTLYIITGVNP